MKWSKLKQGFLSIKIAISNFFHRSHHLQIQKRLQKTTIFNVIALHQWIIVIIHLLFWLLTLILGILTQIYPDENNQVFNFQATIWLTFIWTTLVLSYFCITNIYNYLQLRDRDLFADRFSKHRIQGPKINHKIKRQIRDEQLIKSVFGANDADQNDVDFANQLNH